MRDSCGDGHVVYLHGIHANILVVILCKFCKMSPQGKIGKGYMGSLYIILTNVNLQLSQSKVFFKKYVLRKGQSTVGHNNVG